MKWIFGEVRRGGSRQGARDGCAIERNLIWWWWLRHHHGLAISHWLGDGCAIARLKYVTMQSLRDGELYSTTPSPDGYFEHDHCFYHFDFKVHYLEKLLRSMRLCLLCFWYFTVPYDGHDMVRCDITIAQEIFVWLSCHIEKYCFFQKCSYLLSWTENINGSCAIVFATIFVFHNWIVSYER